VNCERPTARRVCFVVHPILSFCGRVSLLFHHLPRCELTKKTVDWFVIAFVGRDANVRTQPKKHAADFATTNRCPGSVSPTHQTSFFPTTANVSGVLQNCRLLPDIPPREQEFPWKRQLDWKPQRCGSRGLPECPADRPFCVNTNEQEARGCTIANDCPGFCVDFGPVCNGIAGLQCPEGLECVNNDPRDTCVEDFVSDCFGVCVNFNGPLSGPYDSWRKCELRLGGGSAIFKWRKESKVCRYKQIGKERKQEGESEDI
jgi:hypothetical protein